jgi:hypothetical protein
MSSSYRKGHDLPSAVAMLHGSLSLGLDFAALHRVFLPTVVTISQR